MNLKPQPNSRDTTSKTAEKVEQAKVAVGKGWEAVRNMNWRDYAKREAAEAPKTENQAPGTWGRLLSRVVDQYHHIRDGGNGMCFPFFTSFLLTISLESDDDTPENTHTQRVLAEYYMSTQGSLPQWLPPPPNRTKSVATSSSSGHHPTPSNASSGSGSSTYRSGSKPSFLQDIYASVSPSNQVSQTQHNYGRSQDLSSDYARRGDQFRDKLRPQAPSSSPRPGDRRDREGSDSFYNDRQVGYSERGQRSTKDPYALYRPHSQGSDVRNPRGYTEGNSSRDRRDYYSRR